MRGVFVTGTDTGVGKTVVGCALARALVRQGETVAVRKPVESGCEPAGDGLHPADGEALRRAAAGRELYDLIAAARTGTPEDFYIVEGAGGFLSPLAKGALNADLARSLGVPVLLVVADRLGCINHALLSVEAIEHRGLNIAAVVVNAVTADVDGDMNNREDLEARLPYPVLPFGHGEDIEAADRLSRLFMKSGTTDEHR